MAKTRMDLFLLGCPHSFGRAVYFHDTTVRCCFKLENPLPLRGLGYLSRPPCISCRYLLSTKYLTPTKTNAASADLTITLSPTHTNGRTHLNRRAHKQTR